MTKHHQYADGGCLNLEPIGNNELARLAGVSKSTSHEFFVWAFGSYDHYEGSCRNAGILAFHLRRLNKELSPAQEHQLYTDLTALAVKKAKETDDE